MHPQQLGRASTDSRRGPGSGLRGSSVWKKDVGDEMKMPSSLSQDGGGEMATRFGDKVLGLGFMHSIVNGTLVPRGPALSSTLLVSSPPTHSFPPSTEPGAKWALHRPSADDYCLW